MNKTILALALGLGLASNAPAASILWSVGNAAIRDFTVSGETVTEGTTYLANANLYFYLGTTTTEEVESAFSTGTFQKDSFASATFLEQDVSTTRGARAAGTVGVTLDAISASTANNFFLVIAATKDDGTYYKYLTGTQTGFDSTKDPPDPSTTMSFSRADVQSKTWTAVPEPSTAALALAGLALLIKRRRA